MTTLLIEWSQGDEVARDRLVEILYDDLRSRAQHLVRRERREHTISPSALVHEAFLRFIKSPQVNWQNRTHFLSTAARVMRRILVEHARSRLAEKRGRGETFVSLDICSTLLGTEPLDVIDVDTAVEELATLDELQSRIVDLRFFGGLSIDETADALELSPATIKREWQMARTWLSRRLEPELDAAPR